MLSDRRRMVLAALIEEYVANAAPVGSRTLTERYHLGVSPATVRNDLSALEDAGYITQPHTSAGRIPTDSGYRAFVDELLSSGLASEETPHKEIVDELRRNARELDMLMDSTSAALSRMTDCLAVVMAPSLIGSHLRQLSLISLTNRRALIVLVAEDGQVFNRQISFPEDVPSNELADIQNLFNDIFVGKTSAEIKGHFDAKTIDALRDPLAALILEELVDLLSEQVHLRTHRDGMSALLRKPEFSQASSLLPVIQMLEDDTILFNVLDQASVGDKRSMVRIGHENTAATLPGISVVASQYGRGDSSGIVAVIGPTRMDYQKVIRAVRAAQQALGDE
ncbi:MAG: heat-inducible transcription repressor HrcA [Eggerthellaceae bacterium]|nr:heat-inducible transcription repressor HrcA [Eggerthellaceae bacterium]